jgi:hypothetical protein
MERYTKPQAEIEADAITNRLRRNFPESKGSFTKEQYEEAEKIEADEIYKTAVGTIRDLAAFTDIEMAKEIWQQMGGEESNKGFTEKTSGKPHLVELRYKTSDMIIRDLSENDNVRQAVEIASGFTPHAQELLGNNVLDSYVEADLPINTEEKKSLNQKINPDTQIEYVPGNIFDEESWDEIAAKLRPGSVVIFSEGFMLYTSEKERDTLAKYVKRILGEHGGYFVFEDSTRFHPEFIQYPNFRQFFEKLSNSSKRDMQAVSQEDMTAEWEDRGFKVERIAEDLPLSSEEKLPELSEEIDLIKKNYKMWKLSLAK